MLATVVVVMEVFIHVLLVENLMIKIRVDGLGMLHAMVQIVIIVSVVVIVAVTVAIGVLLIAMV